MHKVAAATTRLTRVLSLIFLAVAGTTTLMLAAPGFFADLREMDAEHGSIVRSDLAEQRVENGSLASSLHHLADAWIKGELGTSRQYGVPVIELMRERAAVTAKLLLKSLALGWALAFATALPLSIRRRKQGERVITLTTGAFLCVPIGVLATLCLLLNRGGPVLVLGALIAVRDFKLLYRMLRQASKEPRMLYAQAQGYSRRRAVRVHLLRNLRMELLTLFMMSLVVALSAAVPVEVIFDKPGLGQLAWSAAMNRDLPVLVSITAVMAALVGFSSMFAGADGPLEGQRCA